METFKISNFKYGLDTRREQLTSQPGTLFVGENLHVNPGAELEKRKAFVQHADLSDTDGNGDQLYWGLEDTSVGLMVFGSALSYASRYIDGTGVSLTNISSGGSGGKLNVTTTKGVITSITVNTAGSGYAANDYVTPSGINGAGAVVKILTVSGGGIVTVSLIRGSQQGQPSTATALTAGYTYQQLKHPALTDSLYMDGPYGDAAIGGGPSGVTTVDAVNYDRTKHRITNVTFSNNYNGNSFVSAAFADGKTFLYYNGSVVRQSSDGFVLSSYPTNQAISNYLAYRIAQQFLALDSFGVTSTIVTTSNGITDIVAVPSLGNQVSVVIGSPSGVSTFTMSATISGAGELEVWTKTATTTPASGNSIATFTVAGIVGNSYLMAVPEVFGKTLQVYLTLTGVAWGTSNNATAAAIATAINAMTTVHGYSATSSSAVVTVVAPRPSTPTTGSYNQGTLVVTSADATANGNHAFSTSSYNNAFGVTGSVTVDKTWASGDTYTITGAYGAINFTFGIGNIAGQTYACSLKLGQRMFIGFGSTFAFSAVGNPNGWEEQNTGAGTVSFLSQYGGQDSVKAFSHLQGRLAVFGSQSIQMWTTAANPASFALVQTLDNSGTIATYSVQALGDYDVYYLDTTGVRSLRTQQVTNNAFVDDVGVAIDLTLRAALVSYDTSGIVSIIEPTTRQYWLYVNGSIYVLSNYPSAKILAWSVYKPSYQSTDIARVSNTSGATIRFFVGDSTDYTKYTAVASSIGQYFDVISGGTQDITLPASYMMVALPGNAPLVADTLAIPDNFSGLVTYTFGGTPTLTLTYNQQAFTPFKFVVHSKQVYVRATNNKVYIYGGTDNNTYDNTQPVVELPWLDHNEPSVNKTASGIDAALLGRWAIYTSMNPKNTIYQRNINRGSPTSPSIVADSTYNIGHFPVNGFGTHFKIRAVGGAFATNAKLAMLNFMYEKANIK